jgi:hypothetical protein
MKIFSLGNHLTPYLLATCTLLVGTLALESHNLVQTQTGASNETQPADDQIERTSFNAPRIDAFSEITERPLFREGREPAPEVVATVAATKISPLRLQLEGVAITPESRIALVRDLSNNKMLHLATGAKHQGWELTDITDSVAIFKRGEESHELSLKID